MKAWRADNIPPEPGAADRVSPGSALSALNKASLMKKIEDAKLTRARRGIVEREYHRVDTCNSTYRAWVIAQRDYLLALADRLPAATDEQKRWLADEIDQALRIFASSG